LAAAWHQGPHDDNINQNYSGIGYYRIKRLQGQQHNGGSGSSDGSLAAPHNNSINQKYSGMGNHRITRLRGQQHNSIGGSGGSWAAVAATWQ
jgi:hypothetical protein